MVKLDSNKLSPELEALQEFFGEKMLGQEKAIRQLLRSLGVVLAGFRTPGRPVLNLLMLGPTGVGKTYLAELLAESLYGTKDALIKIDCAEFSRAHEISKLMGSPPGYLGHKETSPRITQKMLEAQQSKGAGISTILFDEIEKAHPDFWNLLLGIMDKASLTLGDSTTLDFQQSIILMSSNLGAKDIDAHLEGGLGLVPKVITKALGQSEELFTIAKKAAQKNFSPEFMNRIDRVVVLRPLTKDQLKQILELELKELSSHILKMKPLALVFDESAKELLLEEGTSIRYGARPLKRALQKYVLAPLSRMVLSNQLKDGDICVVKCSDKTLEFFKSTPQEVFVAREEAPIPDPVPVEALVS